MLAVDLFARNNHFIDAAKKHGYDLYTTFDNDLGNIDQVCSFLDFDVDKMLKDTGRKPDVMWASPPCNTFSLLSVGHHWHADRSPKSDQCKDAIKMIIKIKKIIKEVKPKFWFIENPRALLRKQKMMEDLPRHTITYCSYDDPRMKPTDIWTNLNWLPRPMCFNNNPNCNHLRSPSGVNTGTLSYKRKDRAIIPSELFDELFEVIKVNIEEPNKVFKGQQTTLNI